MNKLLLTEKEIKKLLGVGEEILDMWKEKDGFPKPLKLNNTCGEFGYGRKRYYYKAVVEWLEKKNRESNRG